MLITNKKKNKRKWYSFVVLFLCECVLFVTRKWAERKKKMKPIVFIGTTWTQEMVWCIAKDLDFEGAKQFLPERFPFLE